MVDETLFLSIPYYIDFFSIMVGPQLKQTYFLGGTGRRKESGRAY